MVGLMVKKMHQQAEERFVGGHALGVAVAKRLIQLWLDQGRGPAANQFVEPLAMLSQAFKLAKQLLVEAGRFGQVANRRQSWVVGRVAGEALQPDAVGNQQVV